MTALFNTAWEKQIILILRMRFPIKCDLIWILFWSFGFKCTNTHSDSVGQTLEQFKKNVLSSYFTPKSKDKNLYKSYLQDHVVVLQFFCAIFVNYGHFPPLYCHWCIWKKNCKVFVYCSSICFIAC